MMDLDMADQRFRESRERATRAALLLNGVGALFLLLFLAHLFTLAHTKKLPLSDFILDLTGILWTLFLGVLLVAVHYTLEYVRAPFAGSGGWLLSSLRAIAFLCILASYGCFAYAAYQVHAAFVDYLPVQ